MFGRKIKFKGLLDEARAFAEHMKHSFRLNFQKINVLKYVVCIIFRGRSDNGLYKKKSFRGGKGGGKRFFPLNDFL